MTFNFTVVGIQQHEHRQNRRAYTSLHIFDQPEAVHQLKALPACLLLYNYAHVCEEVSSRRIQAGVLEYDSETSSEDHDLVLHGLYIVKLSMELHVNVTKCIGILL